MLVSEFLSYAIWKEGKCTAWNWLKSDLRGQSVHLMTKLIKDEQVTEKLAPGFNIHNMNNGHTTLNHYLATGSYLAHSSVRSSCCCCCSQVHRSHRREQYAATKQPRYSCWNQTLPEGDRSVKKTITPLWSPSQQGEGQRDRERRNLTERCNIQRQIL